MGYGHVKERNTHTCMHRPATYLQLVQENFKPHRPETDWPFITFELRTDFPFKGSIILLGLFAFYYFRRCHGNLGNEFELRLSHVLNFKLRIVVCNFNQSIWCLKNYSIIFTLKEHLWQTSYKDWYLTTWFIFMPGFAHWRTWSYFGKYVIPGLFGELNRLILSEVQL